MAKSINYAVLHTKDRKAATKYMYTTGKVIVPGGGGCNNPSVLRGKGWQQKHVNFPNFQFKFLWGTGGDLGKLWVSESTDTVSFNNFPQSIILLSIII